MTKNQTKKIFEQYNPASGIVRCPKGRAKMRKPLDLYAKAAVNLYGIIKLKEFVRIFNEQNEEQTTVDEVYTILLPNVHKFGWYGFYKDYLTHYVVLHNFDFVSYLEREQAGKPRYVPKKEKFLQYEWEDYNDSDHWQDVLEFMLNVFRGNKNTVEGYYEIKTCVTHNIGIKEIGLILEKYDLLCESEKQFQEFMKLLIFASNNTRKWENLGHTPEEMNKHLADNRPKEPVFNFPKKIGSNQICPCGSGKKYKRCCKLIEDSGAAQLSFSECKLFYETWYKLLDFINKKYSVVNMKIEPVYLVPHDESQIYKIREKLWAQPGIIGEFISSTNKLSDAEIDLLQSWEKRHIKGQFLLMKYESEYAVFMRSDKGEDHKLYAVKGITTSVSEAIHRQLPVMLGTVLLPFGDKIIYDSFMASHDVSFGDGMRELLNEEYNKAKDEYGIVTRF